MRPTLLKRLFVRYAAAVLIAIGLGLFGYFGLDGQTDTVTRTSETDNHLY